MRKPEPKDYLLLTGALNTVAFAFSIITFALLGKARNGAIVGVGELLESMSMTQVWFFAFLFLFVGGIATLLGLYFAKSLLVVLQKVNYTKLVKGLLYFLLVLVLVLSSWQGVLILLTATGLGLLAQFYGAQKNMLLGCLLLPVILYFLA
jgi:TctA family transporter